MWPAISRMIAYTLLASVFLYLLNNYLVFWQLWPGPYQLLFDPGYQQLSEQGMANKGWLLLAVYTCVLMSILWYAARSSSVPLHQHARRLDRFNAYLVRACFWAVCLVGLVDAGISFVRIEQLFDGWLSNEWQSQLGRPAFRGSMIHLPIIVLSFLLAALIRTISVSWLVILVVMAEFLLVVSRFVFSYEQAFMGDLIRFWYAALFLFASACTLLEDGHVRVDVLYSRFSEHGKAISNLLGSLLLGLPLCWVILMQGMAGRGNSINNPLLSVEISQSGYGMYVKYLMAGFLVVFAVTMLIQFVSLFLKSVATLTRESATDLPPAKHDTNAVVSVH